MKIYKTKTGEKIDAKEFFKKWKKGINSITPLQKLQNEQRATFIMMVGYLVGLVSLVIYRDLFVVMWFTYALIIIFFGALFGQVIRYLTLRTQLKLFKDLGDESLDLNKIMESLEAEPIKEEKAKPIILDDNPLSLSKYAEEFPENFEKIAEIKEDKEIDNAEKEFRKDKDERRLE